MVANTTNLKLNSLKGATITVNVELSRWFHARVRIGVWLMRFGAWITGAACRVEQRPGRKPHCGFCGRSDVCLVSIESSADLGICQLCHDRCGRVMRGEI